MKKVTNGRLDRTPEPARVPGTHVSGLDLDLGRAVRERVERVTAVQKPDSASDREVLLDEVEAVMPASLNPRYTLQEVSGLIQAIHLVSHLRLAALGPDRQRQEQSQMQRRSLCDLLEEDQAVPHPLGRRSEFHPGDNRCESAAARSTPHRAAAGLTSTTPQSIDLSSAARFVGSACRGSRKLRSTATAPGAAARLTAAKSRCS
jgi:hypothetical protein